MHKHVYHTEGNYPRILYITTDSEFERKMVKK